jgi:type IV secretory pathway protease TraF
MGSSSYALAGHIINTSLSAFICLYAVDEAGNISNDTCVLYAVPQGVAPTHIETISLSIFPSPMESVTSILLSGAPSADVEIFDVLGREVDHFQMHESYDWQTAALPSGTYIVRAVVSGTNDAQTITKRIVKE